MQIAAFSAKSPYEIGDRIRVLMAAGQNENGVLFATRIATITDIACTHYLREGKVLFTYELDGSGKYAPLLDPKEAGLTV